MSIPVEEKLTNIYANLSWYELNSNYNDTVYQKQRMKLVLTLATLPQSRFVTDIDTSNVVDVYPRIKYGTMPCFANNREAYMDSTLSCALFQLPFFLENIQFGFLCGIVIIPIMLISLFGKIKESYRWFVLNQAIWDTFMCYSFICEKPTVLVWTNSMYEKPKEKGELTGIHFSQYATCFYTGEFSNYLVEAVATILKESFRNGPYVPLFLLAFSRCISLYFPNFYERHNKTWKVLLFIFISDVSFMLISSAPKFQRKIITFLQKTSAENCFNTFCSGYNNFEADHLNCYRTTEKYFQCTNRMRDFYGQFMFPDIYRNISITPIMFCLVLFCVFALFTKVAIQLNYQLKHNRAAFSKTIKVVVVIGIQSITLSFYLSITAIQTYFQVKAARKYFSDDKIYESLSPTLFLLQSFATTTSFNIMRIFFDSFVVLTVLTGYRNVIFTFFVFFINGIKKLLGHKNERINVVRPISTTVVPVVMRRM